MDICLFLFGGGGSSLVFQRRYSQSSKQTVQGKQGKGTNEQLSLAAWFPSTAPNQEPTVDRLVCPPLLNLIPEPYVRISGLNFGSNFMKMQFCGLAPSAKIAPKIHAPSWKICAKIRSKTPPVNQNPHQVCSKIFQAIYLQGPTASFQKVTRGAP